MAGALYSRMVVLTYAAAVTVDWSQGNVQSLTLTGNATLTFSNGRSGGKYILILKQGGTGSMPATWPANARFSGGTAPVPTATAGKTDYVGFVYNGVVYAKNPRLKYVRLGGKELAGLEKGADGWTAVRTALSGIIGRRYRAPLRYQAIKRWSEIPTRTAWHTTRQAAM